MSKLFDLYCHVIGIKFILLSLTYWNFYHFFCNSTSLLSVERAKLSYLEFNRFWFPEPLKSKKMMDYANTI